MTVAIVAGLAMLFSDILNALYVLMLDKDRSVLAGMFDGFADLGALVSYGGGISTIFHHRIDFTTYLTMSLILAGSVGGAYLGNRLSKRLTGHPPTTRARLRLAFLFHRPPTRKESTPT